MTACRLDHPARTAFGQSRLTTDKTRAGVFSGALGQIRLWSDISIAWLTAEQDHDLAQAGSRPTAVYLVIPDERSTYDMLATLYVTQMYQALVDLSNVSPGRKLPVRVNFLLDEFGNLPPFPDFCKKLTTSAGRNIRFTLAVQGIDQIEKLYLKDARTISGNCWTWIYLLTSDKMTAEVIAEKIGKYTVQTESYSQQPTEPGLQYGNERRTGAAVPGHARRGDAVAGRRLLHPANQDVSGQAAPAGFQRVHPLA